MFQLAAVFSPGFEKVIPTVLRDVIPDAYNIDISSGFARFCVDKKPFRAKNADFFNNSFLVLREWNVVTPKSAESSRNGFPQTTGSLGGGREKHAPTFETMAKKIKIPQNLIPEILKQNYKSFRLRFSQANVFTSVSKQLMANVEKQISMQTGLTPNRLGGDTEFWFLTRNDGYACFALRMTKKQSTEKYLEKGELRPEFVTLLAAFAGVTKQNSPNTISKEENNLSIRIGGLGDTSLPIRTGGFGGDSISPLTILDPFAGHGGIVKRLAEIAPNAKIIASEIDAELVKKLELSITRNKPSAPKNTVSGTLTIHQADAIKLDFINDKSVDIILTDPPWGFFQGDLRNDKKLRELYDGMLKEFHRVIKPNSTICVLTGAKEVFEAAFDDSEFAKEPTSLNTILKGENLSTDESVTCGKDIRNDVLVNGKKAAVYVWKSQSKNA